MSAGRREPPAPRRLGDPYRAPEDWDGLFAAIQDCIRPGAVCDGPTIISVLAGALCSTLEQAPAKHRLALAEEATDLILAYVLGSLRKGSRASDSVDKSH